MARQPERHDAEEAATNGGHHSADRYFRRKKRSISARTLRKSHERKQSVVDWGGHAELAAFAYDETV